MQSVQQRLQLKNQQEIATLDVFLSEFKSCARVGSNYNPPSRFGAGRDALHKFLYDLWRLSPAKGLASLDSWTGLFRMLAASRRVGTCQIFNHDGRDRIWRVCARAVSEAGAPSVDYSACGKLSSFGSAG